MSTIIRTGCHLCGTVELSPVDITIDLHALSFWFECPFCRCTIHRDADQRVIRLLHFSGACVAADPITEEEIERFRIQLDKHSP